MELHSGRYRVERPKMKKPQHWQAIYGSFSFKPDEVIFHGEPVTVAGAANPIGSVGLAMSDAVYAGGTIVARIGYEKAKSIPSVQIVLARNPLDNSILTAGIEGG